MKNRFKDKTVLVTGATGLIGSNLCKHLIDEGAYVIAMARNETRLKQCFSQYIHKGELGYIAADVSDTELRFSVLLDYVFHAAGSVASSDIESYPLDVINPNVLGTINLLKLIKKQEEESGKQGRILFFSSETVYGKWLTDRIVEEDDTSITDPVSSQRAAYSQSKRMGEVIMNAYVKQYNIDAINVRLAWVYGNAEFKAKQALFDFMETALAGNDIVIKNANTHRRDNLSMQDAISALLLIALRGKKGETYNISSGGDMGNYAAADEIANHITDIINERKLTHRIVNVVYETKRTRREGGVVMENSKLKGLGWSVTTSLRDGIQRIVDVMAG